MASWLEQDRQQRQQLPGRSQLGIGQQGYKFGWELGQGQSVASFPEVESPHGQHVQSGQAQGIYTFVLATRAIMLNVHVCVRACVCVRPYVRMYVCMHVCVYVQVFVSHVPLCLSDSHSCMPDWRRGAGSCFFGSLQA